MSEPASAEQDQPVAGVGEVHRDLSGVYERTWELELLISGAVVFALLQLPDRVDAWYWRTEQHLGGALQDAAFMLYYYLKLILYTLIFTFVVHLAARAYWVGLIGLDAAFPRGVQWDRSSYGPITRAVYRERQPSLEALIARADRFCNVLFSFSFSIVFIFLTSLVLLPALALLAFGISLALVGGEHSERVFQVLLALLIVPILVVGGVDRRWGNRLDRSRGVGRVIDRTVHLYARLFFSVSYLPVWNTLQTNIPGKRFQYVFFATFFGTVMVFFVRDIVLPSGRIQAGSYAYLPDEADAYGVEAVYYADRVAGEERRRNAAPTLQSEVIRGGFVRLFVPYVPERHEAAIERQCPEVEPLTDAGIRWVGRDAQAPPAERMEAVLRCLERIHPVQLNGREVRPRYRFYTEAETGRRGVVAFLPAGPLPEGENLLVVSAVPRSGAGRQPDPHVIPFWLARPDPRGGM